MGNSKESFITYLKGQIVLRIKDGFDGIRIEDENEYEGLHMTIVHYKTENGMENGIAETINEWREPFYKLTMKDIDSIKSELKLKRMTMAERTDFGMQVRSLKIQFK